MTIVDLESFTEISNIPRGGCVALGNFDGFHLGHAKIVSEATEIAHTLGTHAVLWTFSSVAKADGESPRRICTHADKLRYAADAGAKYAVIADFADVRDMSPEDFVSNILVDRLGCAAAVCGFNFRFGKNAVGDSTLLARLLEPHGAQCVAVEPVYAEIGGKRTLISSTEIRKYVAAGDVASAELMLGRPFTFSGEVAPLDLCSRGSDTPAVQLMTDKDQLLPAAGIYISHVSLNCGIFPARTITTGDIVEIHVTGYEGNLIDRRVTLEIIGRLPDGFGE